jgi:hypothetical protein
MNSWGKYSLIWYSNVKCPEGDCVVPLEPNIASAWPAFSFTFE